MPTHIYIYMNTYKYIYIYMPTYIYIYTNAHTHIHIYWASGYPPSADAPHRRCQLPAQTLRLRNRKSSLKLRIFHQPGTRTR